MHEDGIGDTAANVLVGREGEFGHESGLGKRCRQRTSNLCSSPRLDAVLRLGHGPTDC
jgi:hypothetical protein